jgi:hypothetical protein
VAQAISDVPLLTQDGGNYSDTRVLQLSTREERFWKSKATLIQKTETLVSTHLKVAAIKSGTSSMLMNGRENQEKEK